MGHYEELSRERRQFLDDYLSNPDKPQWKCYQDAFGCTEDAAHANASRLLNKDKILQAIAELLGPAKTRIVVKLSKMGDTVVQELKSLIESDPTEKITVGDGQALINNRAVKLEAIKTYLDRIGIEGSSDDINIAIDNSTNESSEETVNVNLDNLSEDEREDFIRKSREVFIE